MEENGFYLEANLLNYIGWILPAYNVGTQICNKILVKTNEYYKITFWNIHFSDYTNIRLLEWKWITFKVIL